MMVSRQRRRRCDIRVHCGVLIVTVWVVAMMVMLTFLSVVVGANETGNENDDKDRNNAVDDRNDSRLETLTVQCLYIRGVMRTGPSTNTNDKNRSDEHFGSGRNVLHRCLVPEEQSGVLPEMVYDLPDSLMDALTGSDRSGMELQSGRSWITLPTGATIDHAHGVLLWDIQQSAQISVEPYRTRQEQNLGIRHERQRKLSTKGPRSVMVVRVLSRDGLDPTPDRSRLYRNYFGEGTSFANQFQLCSAGQVTMYPAPIAVNSNDNNDTPGIIDLFVDQDFGEIKEFTSTLENSITLALEERFGSTVLSGDVDHVLVCLPRSTRLPWIAFTYPNTQRSYYRDEWCGYYSTPFHEVGHNLGLQHSGATVRSAGRDDNDDDEGSHDEYGDRTCLMGDSYPREQGPRMCWNGHKFWSLGWFGDKQVSIDSFVTRYPSDNGQSSSLWTGHLVAFVDANKIEPDNPQEVVIIRVGNLYILNNRAKDFNYETQGHRNMVTVTQADGYDSPSTLVAALDERPDQNTMVTEVVLTNETDGMNEDGDNNNNVVSLVVEVCERQRRNTTDYYVVTIRWNGTDSTCPNVTAEEDSVLPSQSPSRIPSLTPSIPLSEVPSMIPSQLSPSSVPSSLYPSEMPSEVPSTTPSSLHPSEVPSTTPSSFHPSTIPSTTKSILHPSTIPSTTPSSFHPSTIPSTIPSLFPSHSSRIPLPDTGSPATTMPTLTLSSSSPTTDSFEYPTTPSDCLPAGGHCQQQVDCCDGLICHGPHPQRRWCLQNVDRYYIRGQFWKLGQDG